MSTLALSPARLTVAWRPGAAIQAGIGRSAQRRAGSGPCAGKRAQLNAMCVDAQTARPSRQKLEWVDRQPIMSHHNAPRRRAHQCGRGGFVHSALKAFSFLVLGLMGSAILYASCIAVTYWAGISV